MDLNYLLFMLLSLIEEKMALWDFILQLCLIEVFVYLNKLFSSMALLSIFMIELSQEHLCKYIQFL